MRLSLLSLFLLLFSASLIVKLLLIQFSDKGIYTVNASGQYLAYQEFTPKRGDIFVIERNSNNLVPIAENKEFANVFAVPNEVENAYYVAAELASILDIDERTLLERVLKEADPYEPIKNKISDDEKTRVENRGFKGIYIEESTYRHYPLAEDMSHITGFVGNTGDTFVGQYGAEGYYEDILGGREGYITYAKDALGNLLKVFRREEQKVRSGNSIVLTIDRVLQFRACSALSEYVEKTGAEGGSVIVMEVETGKVRALCSNPAFNANTFYETEDIQVFNNPAITKSYEPGSVFKPITMAAAMNEEAVSPSTTYVDEGKLQYGKFVIENSDQKAHGEVDMVTVLTQSLNTGAVFVAEQIGKDIFTEYVKRFGFGEKTGIELSGERTGTIASLEKPGEIFMATASYGQGITATPIQLAAAYAALANNGKYVKPTILEKIIYKNDEAASEKFEEREILGSRAATLVNSILVSVVDNGQAKLAGVKGYRIAGKTGTAEIPDQEGGGYLDATNHTFIGFGPVEDPFFVALVKLDRPTSYPYSSGTAAPLFGELSAFILQYYNIPPTVE